MSEKFAEKLKKMLEIWKIHAGIMVCLGFITLIHVRLILCIGELVSFVFKKTKKTRNVRINTALFLIIFADLVGLFLL